jgi:NarL family two-component system response regulator LiaR
VQLRTETSDGLATIEIQGEVDLSNVASLREELTAALDAGATSLVLDCGRLTFIDSTGLGVLAKTSYHLATKGGSVVVRNPTPLMRRLLEMTRLKQALPIETPALHPDLTERQREVLALLADGLGNAEIAEALFISPETVKSHLRTIFERLGVNNRTQAARYVTELRAR